MTRQASAVIVCTIPDDTLKGTKNLKIVNTTHSVIHDAIIIANAVRLPDTRPLYEAGAAYVFLQRVETAHAVEHAIEKTLAGEIETHRTGIDARYGKWHTRDEIM